jgi:hypothetical protein
MEKSNKRPGRQPSNFRIAAIVARYGSVEAFDAKVSTMSRTEFLLANDTLQRETAKLKAQAKGSTGLRGRKPGEARLEAVKLLHNISYPEFRAWTSRLSDEDRLRTNTVVDALATLIDAGVTLTADEGDVFMDNVSDASETQAAE